MKRKRLARKASPNRKSRPARSSRAGIPRSPSRTKTGGTAAWEPDSLFRDLAEQSPNMIFINCGGRIVYANKKCEEIMGYLRKQFYGLHFNFLDLVAPQHRAQVMENFRKHQAGVEVKPAEYELITRTGRHLSAIHSTALIQYAGMDAVLGIVTDITEKRKAEEILRESEKKYRQLFNSSTDAVTVHLLGRRGTGRFLEVNNAAVQLYGHSRAQLLRMKPTDFDTGRQTLGTAMVVELLHRRGRALFERMIRAKSGEVIPVEVLAQRIVLRGQSAVLAVLRDIRERRKAEQALRTSEREKSIILDSVSEMIVYHDRSLRILWANRAAASAAGLSADALKGQFCYRVIQGRSGRCNGCPVSKTLQSGEPKEAELSTKSGAIWHIRSHPVHDETGKIFGIVEVIQDITERRKAEDALRKERNFSNTLVQASPAFFVAISPKGKIMMMNQAMLKILGYKKNEVIGKDFMAHFVPERERTAVREIFTSLLNARKPTYHENHIIAKCGSEFLVEWHGRGVFMENGDIDFIFGVGIDITKRRAAEAALRESEERYRSFIERANDGIALIQDGRFRYANQKLLDLHGLPDLDFHGKEFIDYIAPDQRKKVRQYYQDRLQNKAVPSIYESAILRENGRRVEVEFNAGTVMYEGRSADLVFVRDITERRMTEKALRDSELLNRTAINSMKDAIHVVDKDLRIVLCNQVLLEWNRELGYSSDLVGKTIAEAFPFLNPGVSELYKRICANGKPIRTEDETNVAGRAVVTETDRIPVLEEGKVIRVITVIRDVTPRKMAEKELRNAKESAEKANRAKSDFLTAMSHELRTPLTSILGFADLFAQRKIGNLADRDLVFVDKILRNGQHLLTLINGLLDLARIESGRAHVQLQSVDLQEIVDHVTTAAISLVKNKPVKVRAEVPYPGSVIRTDPVRLKQLLFNLVGNAIKFTERGRVEVRVQRRSLPVDPVRIHVIDTGIGISAERLPGIFDRFAQPGPQGGKQQGAGLGLAISKSIVELLGGKIEVRSKPNKGSIFTICLPVETPARHGQ